MYRVGRDTLQNDCNKPDNILTMNTEVNEAASTTVPVESKGADSSRGGEQLDLETWRARE